MKLPPLTVIEASAGTGKTFSLVTRLLRLIFSGVEPERIVALTFSRLAAGEIFNSFIERLSKASSDEKTAAEESERMGKKITRGEFAAMLRKVISRQHLSLIGTLDSFMMKIVRMMPLELGLEGEISVMSEYRSPVERLRLVGEMMMMETDDAKEFLRDTFRLVYGNVGSRTFRESFSDFIQGWHQRYRDLEGQQAAWGEASAIWGKKMPKDLEVSLGEIRSLADGLAGYAGKKGADKFIEAVREFGGTVPDLPKCLSEEPVALDALVKMRAWKIAKALKTTQGIFRLMRLYEKAYAVKIRSRGLITFDDMPRMLEKLSEAVKLALEYRMDSKFDHWALDEFQDTSRTQWNALKNLIYEAGQSLGDKSVFVVGDRKQAIYDWRGGDVGILSELAELAKQGDNRLEPLDESRRYVPVIADAVNQIFKEDNVRFLIDMDSAPECAKWRCRRHESHEKDKSGFVEVIQAEKAGRTAKLSDFFAPVENALNAVRPWERGISAAILVRKNSTGEALLAYLKSKGMKNVVFEGDSAISDSPVLSAMAELVQLAEHADDDFAYAHIKCSPIAAAMYPDGLPAPAALSARLLEDFTRVGMVRKFREVREALKKIPDSWNDFTESRFEDFIKCAAEFEELRDSSMRLSDFTEYLSHRTRRDFAEPGMVRIMTMHQSKGLGFDWVIIPFYEPEKLIGERHTGPLVDERSGWIMLNPGTEIDRSDPVLSAAERERQQKQIYDSLCLDYVAMTRAKRALTIILHPQNKDVPESPEKFSDLVRASRLKTTGASAWYQEFEVVEKKEDPAKRLRIVRAPRRPIRKSRPSESFYEGLAGDLLFSENFGAAAKRGTEAHARYEQIEWLDAKDAKTDFDRALVKPSADATVWRERSYELFMDGKWESGQFDRVVFSKGAAVIYDFKTNAKRGKETDAEFAERMRETYKGQLSAYRQALSALTGIPASKIKTVLLLETTGAAVGI